MNTRTLKLMTLAATLTLAFALPASARGLRGRGGPGLARPRPARTLHARGLLGQLVFPCPAACADEAETCFDAAESEALGCISDACASEVAAAQTACGEDRRSEACFDAVEALVDCAGACLDAHADAAGVCRDTLIDCHEACGADE